MVGGSRPCPVDSDDELRETMVFLWEGSLLSCSSYDRRMSQIDESCSKSGT